MESLIDIDDVILRLMTSAGCDSQGALSERFGHKKNAIASGRRRHKSQGGLVGVPIREAIQLALEKGESLDWLILGRRPDRIAGAPSQAGIAEDGGQWLEGLVGEGAGQPGAVMTWKGVEGARPERPQKVAPEQLAKLEAIVVRMEQELQALGASIHPERKARLLTALFDHFAAMPADLDRDLVGKVVAIAAETEPEGR